MVRGSAKNHASVAVVTSPGQYPTLLAALAAGGFTLAERQALAAAAFAHTAAYDVAVARWLRQRGHRRRRSRLPGLGRRAPGGGPPCCATARTRTSRPRSTATEPARAGWPPPQQLHGKEMSYNNYVDADAARRAAYDFAEPAVAIIKHANPCGIAVGADIAEAHRKAHACDPVSAFGGVIAANRPVSVAMAEQVAEVFTEVIAGAGVRRRAPSRCCRRRRTSGSSRSSRTERGRRRDPRRSTAGCWCRPATGSTPTTTGAASWQLVAGEPADEPSAGRPGVRLAGGPRRSSPTPSCWPATAPRSGSAWVRSTGSTPAGWRCSGPGTGPPGRWPPPTRSSRSPTARRSCSTPACRRSSSRAGRSATPR